MRLPPLTTLAGLGAFAAAAGIVGLYLLIVFITIPRPETGGIDWTNAVVTWISLGLVVLALLAPHIVYGRILLAQSATARD